jgi:hypothetical protein
MPSSTQKIPASPSNLSRIWIAVVVVLGIIAISIYWQEKFLSAPKTKYEVLEKEIEGNSMEPLLPNGTKILLQI